MQATMSLTLLPAYGRDYKSKKEVTEAWNQNEDFIITNPGIGGRYINKTDAENHSISSVLIRYSNKRKIMEIKLED